MRKQRSGHIINVSSVAGVAGLKHCAAYGATKFAVEGLSLSVATEVEQFGIKITIVEPGPFRTDLLETRNVTWPSNVIKDYAAEGNIPETWSAYHGKQQGDPAKLGEVLVKIAGMENPPQQFLAESDALTVVTPCSRPGCRKCVPMKICLSQRTAEKVIRSLGEEAQFFTKD